MSNWTEKNGRWIHRPWWKVAINAVLRVFQPWPRKLVIHTLAHVPDDGSEPTAVGYGFGRALHEPNRWPW